MSVEDLRFNEVEHKYVVGEEFDLDRFRGALAALHPTRTSTARVLDRYYLTEDGRNRRYIIRHRYDPELHHLTLKTLEVDTQVRVEVNLDLGQHAGDQSAAVDAFLHGLGVVWRGTVHKDVEVWYFPDCEIVHYRASTGVTPDRNAQVRAVRCVEFEAIEKPSLDAALATLHAYERATGFNGVARSRLSLPQILYPEVSEQLA